VTPHVKTQIQRKLYSTMETNNHRSEFEDDLLVQRLGEAFKEARENGKMHVDVDEFHEHYGEPEPNATLEVLKDQGVQ
jgi:hypothetical protein